MMKILLLTLSILSVFILSGCGRKDMLLTPYPIEKVYNHPEQDVHHDPEIYILGTETFQSNSLSRASDIEESALFTIQLTAEQTIFMGYNYFAVYAPVAMSNFQGSTITSVEEFLDKCGSSIVGGFGSAFDKYGFGSYSCNMGRAGKTHVAYIEVAFYKEKPNDVLVWDAMETLGYMRDEGLINDYQEDDMFIMKCSLPANSWIRNIRNRKQ